MIQDDPADHSRPMRPHAAQKHQSRFDGTDPMDLCGENSGVVYCKTTPFWRVLASLSYAYYLDIHIYIILYCIILYYIISYNIILYYIILYYIILYYIIFDHSSIVYYIILYHIYILYKIYCIYCIYCILYMQ